MSINSSECLIAIYTCPKDQNPWQGVCKEILIRRVQYRFSSIEWPNCSREIIYYLIKYKNDFNKVELIQEGVVGKITISPPF